jgi:hypothetical protein
VKGGWCRSLHNAFALPLVRPLASTLKREGGAAGHEMWIGRTRRKTLRRDTPGTPNNFN